MNRGSLCCGSPRYARDPSCIINEGPSRIEESHNKDEYGRFESLRDPCHPYHNIESIIENIGDKYATNLGVQISEYWPLLDQIPLHLKSEISKMADENILRFLENYRCI